MANGITMHMTYNGGFAAISEAATERLAAAVQKATADVRTQAVVEIVSGEKTGRVYMKGKYKDRKHQASAPDETPANDTGNLIASIFYGMENDLSGRVVVSAKYGLYLEVGTARMAPRPFLSPALAHVEPSFIADCAAAIEGH
jgi:HK97 gp10 family phage protein